MEQTRTLFKYVCICPTFLFFRITIFFFFFLYSQAFLNAQYEYIVINEISGDGGNIEAGNDAIVELAGPVGTDIGCMVITNTEWAIVLPAGTTIPSDGVFLIACSERNNVSSGYYTGINTGLSCSVCDFPGLVVDFDVCDDKNVNYVSPSVYTTYGFTLDNQPQEGNKDGDQVMLFRPDGTPHDAVYWGAPDMTKVNGGGMTIGGASGNAGTSSDHVSVQINHPYTLGDNDENGVINDNTNAHIGYRANGGNAAGVYWMPSGNDDLGNPTLFGTQLNIPIGDCNADQKIYTVPALSDPVWVNVGLNLTSCNSTHIRLNDTSPIGNSRQEPKTSTTSSHMDDPDLNTDWTIFDPMDLVPSSINSIIAATQWQITNHPNPSEPNDTDSWDFFYDGGNGMVEIREKNTVNLSLCSAQSVEFQLKVYNYQHVEPLMRSAKLAGSFVRDENGNDQDWTITKVGHAKTDGAAASDNDGVTTFNFTSNTLTAGATHSFTLVWDDYTDCCGSGNNNTVVNQSIAHECYEKVKVNISIAEVLTVSDNAIACPDDFNTNIGLVDFSQLVTSPNANIQYYLKEGVTNGMEETTGTVVETNTTGNFNLPNTLIPPIVIVIEDLANCGANQVITIGESCRNVPPCPEPNGATISKITVCPNEDFTLAIDAALSSDLPNGGTVDWYYGTVGFDPFKNEGTLLGQSEITVANPPAPTSGPVINEVLVDAGNNDGNGGEFIELAGVPGTDLSCYILTDGDDEIILPDGTVIPSDGFLLIASGTNTDAPIAQIDIDLDNCGCFSDPFGSNGAADLQFTNHSAGNGEFLFMYDATGTFVDGILWGGPTAGGGNNHPDATLTKAITIAPNGCTPPATVMRSGQAFADVNLKSAANGVSIELDTDVTGNWQFTDDAAKFTPGATNSGALPITTVTDLVTNLGEDFCNQTIEIKGIVQPATITAICTESTVTTVALSLRVICPEADLQTGDRNLCLPINNSEILATANLSNGSGNYNVSFEVTYNGIVFPLVKNNVSTPLSITYSDIVAAIGTTTFSDIEIRISSIADAGGVFCTGKKDDDVVVITIQDSPTAMISAATDLTDCSGVANGELTFEFSPITSGPWEFEYTINGGSPIVSAAYKSPFILPVATIGIYELQSVNNLTGCAGIINGTTQVVNPPVPLTLNTVNPIAVCNDGSESVDLNKDIIITIDDNGTVSKSNAETIGAIKWYKSDPSLLPLALRSNLEMTTTAFTPITEQNYYFVYKRPADGCEIVGQTSIAVDNFACCTADAGDIIPPSGIINSSICLFDDLGAFEVSYAAADGLSPPTANFQYTFLLVDEVGAILEFAQDGDFDWTTLPIGEYNVYGLSYESNNTPSAVDDYITMIQTDATLDDITQIELDEGSLAFCLNLDGLVESGESLITINGCGRDIPIPTFSQWSLLIFGLLVLNVSLFLMLKMELRN